MKKDNYDDFTEEIDETDAEMNESAETTSAALTTVYDMLDSIITAVVIAIVVLTLFFRTGYVSGPSMQNTMHNRDRYILSELFYTPKQGDIVVFAPGVDIDDEDELWVKRVIATAGQQVFINPEDHLVYVDGVVYDEPYLTQKTFAEKMLEPIEVPEGHVFVMGDNRVNSTDSRVIGCVDTRRVIGKVLFRVFPFNKIGTVK